MEKASGRSHARRDMLIALEKEAQAMWEKEKAFERNAPKEYDPTTKNTWMSTFPYPYMNGRLHLGHVFTLTKAEFITAYHRMKGVDAIFPFAFHVTGMPIKACADKLAREIETYGEPPVFPDPSESKQEETKAPVGKVDPTKFKAKKTKAASKAGKETHQWDIMKMLGIPQEEIPNFRKPEHWIDYFIPLAVDDLKSFGLQVDWRRSFHTTDINPYYDSFIRWQFETLKEQGRVKFGTRYAVFSPLDNQPCADHDRASGEGVQSQEYTNIKLTCIEPFVPQLADIIAGDAVRGRPVHFVAATLRPETMYGQTNCWVLPTGEYGVYELDPKFMPQAEGGEFIVCAARAAMNMSYQGIIANRGQPKPVAMIKGQDLLGQPVTSPNTVGDWTHIYTLPLLSIKMDKGTGIVTSVVSDAPDDYAAFMDLQNKPLFREKFGIKDEWIMPYRPVSIIDVPGFGELSAKTACEQFKVKSANDRDKLAQAKDTVYLKGFYEGVLKVGKFAGKKVMDAKADIRQEMIDAGGAFAYAEPEREVIARSGCECVVALTDQWYLDYGEPTWQKQVREHMETMEFYSDDTRDAMMRALGWLHEWACSRSFGLGTRLPWDPKYLIESLSDSTIYMAFYTIAHILQGSIPGTTQGLGKIGPEKMTTAVWNYIFRSGELKPGDTDIPEETLAYMKREFQYWYPLSIRVSGKDLIQNHLIFWLYNHIAIFDKQFWPRGMRANGHLLLNSDKMSKSTGNFMTIRESMEVYGTDATRFALADAGDGAEDANFADEVANSAILRLTNQLVWFKEILDASEETRSKADEASDAAKLRYGNEDAYTLHDRIMMAEIDLAVIEVDKSYRLMNFREALKQTWWDFQATRDAYRQQCGAQGMHMTILRRFMEVQILLLAPICPHFCEHMWKLMGKEGMIVNARWPEHKEPDRTLIRVGRFLQVRMFLLLLSTTACLILLHSFFDVQDTVINIRSKYMAAKDPKKKGKKKGPAPVVPTNGDVYVASKYQDWQERALMLLKEKCYDESTNMLNVDKAFIGTLKSDAQLKPKLPLVMKFVSFVREDFAKRGLDALELELPFNQREVLEDSLDYVTKVMEVGDDKGDGKVKAKENATPGQPAVHFYAQE